MPGVTGVRTHPVKPPQDHLAASHFLPATEAWVAQASPVLLTTHTNQTGWIQFPNNVQVWLSVCSADLVVAEQTPDRHKCSRCSSSVYGAHTLSLSGIPAPRRLALAASEVAEDTGRSSGAVLTGRGWDIHSPAEKEISHMNK